MTYKKKLFSLDSLLTLVNDNWRKNNKKIVYCHGNFNVVHPGHLRFLEFAKKQGDILIVSVTSDSSLSVNVREHFFDENERAAGVCAVSFVDAVLVIDSDEVLSTIKEIKPDIFIKGIEYKNKITDEEKEAVKSVNCKIVFGSGDLKYSSVELFNEPLETIKTKEFLQLKHACERHNITIDKLRSIINNFSEQRFLVIGDTIVDQYVACDPLGMSSEAPVLVINEIESKEFLGGAGVVAKHVKQLGAKCHFVSVTGNDYISNFVENDLKRSGINFDLIKDETRPTTFKIRYMVNNQKLLRVSRLRDHDIDLEIEEKIMRSIEKIIDQLDGIIVCDFSYGIINQSLFEKINDLAIRNNVDVYCDSQSSSQIGDVTKFKNVNLITPTEREARIALSDKNSGLEKLGLDLLKNTNSKNVVITLSSDGLIAFRKKIINGKYHSDSQHFPALVSNPLDVAGAGDSLLSGMALSLTSGAGLMESSVIGLCIAALAVNKLGNIPISFNELDSYLTEIIDPVLSLKIN